MRAPRAALPWPASQYSTYAAARRVRERA